MLLQRIVTGPILLLTNFLHACPLTNARFSAPIVLSQVLRPILMPHLTAFTDAECFLMKLRQLYEGMGRGWNEGDCRAVYLRLFYDLGILNSEFGNANKQCDPHELMIYLSEAFDYIFSDCQLQIQESMCCPVCQSSRVRTVKTVCHSLAMRLDLTTAWNFFLQPSEIPDWKCGRCPYEGICSLQLRVVTTPRYVCFHMKRWAGILNRKNRDNLCIFKTMIIGTQNYKLYAILEHYGNSRRSGHYVAFVLEDDAWTCLNDLRRIPQPPELNNNKDGYIIIYKSHP
jgi:uncharacterized UBP type Zn finger protein